MTENHTKGEMHGCIVCGKLYQLYVVYDSNGRFVDFKVMSPDAKKVPYPQRPLVACNKHGERDIALAVARAFGPEKD